MYTLFHKRVSLKYKCNSFNTNFYLISCDCLLIFVNSNISSTWIVHGWNEFFDCKYLCIQILLFFLRTSKYCCVAMLTGWRSALETEPTGESRAEAFSSSAVAEDQRPTTIITSNTFYFLKYYHCGFSALTIFYFIWYTSFQLTLHLKRRLKQTIWFLRFRSGKCWE